MVTGDDGLCSRMMGERSLDNVDVWATKSTAIGANQTLLRILCYMPAGGNEAIQGLYKMLAGLLLASGQQIMKVCERANEPILQVFLAGLELLKSRSRINTADSLDKLFFIVGIITSLLYSRSKL